MSLENIIIISSLSLVGVAFALAIKASCCFKKRQYEVVAM